MKKLHRIATGALAALMAAGLAGCAGADDGAVNLTFQIWDVAQRDGMQAMCDAYTAEHPNVHIEVQVTSWDEYWTKLEAAAMSNQMPDIFWMHTNEILKYADYGMLADCSDIVETEHFSDISLANASGSDGKLYARRRSDHQYQRSAPSVHRRHGYHSVLCWRRDPDGRSGCTAGHQKIQKP